MFGVIDRKPRAPSPFSMAIMSEPWLTTKEIAVYCGGVDVSTIQRWCVEHEFPHVRAAGGRGRILSKASWIDQWLMRSAKFAIKEAA
jgi:excisionase family DNA binding protein